MRWITAVYIDYNGGVDDLLLMLQVMMDLICFMLMVIGSLS
jgi:hypothetical protein